MKTHDKNTWVSAIPHDVKVADHLPVASIRQLRDLIATQRAEYEQQIAALRLARAVAVQAEGRS